MEKKGWLVLVVFVLAFFVIGGCSSKTAETQVNESWGKQPQTKCKGISCQPSMYSLSTYELDDNCNCIFKGVREENPFYPEKGQTVNYKTASYPCDRALSQGGRVKGGVNSIKWLTDYILEVYAIANINCAFGIQEMSVEVEGDNINLQYAVARPESGESLLACLCGNELIYTIYNLEKKEYNINLKEV